MSNRPEPSRGLTQIGGDRPPQEVGRSGFVDGRSDPHHGHQRFHQHCCHRSWGPGGGQAGWRSTGLATDTDQSDGACSTGGFLQTAPGHGLLLGQHTWQLISHLAFWIDGNYNREGRHSLIGYLRPIDYEYQFINIHTVSFVKPWHLSTEWRKSRRVFSGWIKLIFSCDQLCLC